MKTNQRNNEENKTTNTQLRRRTMNATKLTMIVFSATAIIISGCSSDNRVTGPGNAVIPDIDKDLVESTAPTETENNAARIAVRDNESGVEHLSIVAEVLRIELEGGCWYLSSESGDNYTPVTPKSLSLELGMKLKANGYIDKKIHFFCGNGPAFVIEQYEILNESKWPSEDRAPRNENTSQLSDTPTEDRAPQSAEKKYDKKKLIEQQISQVPTEDRAPKNENTSQLSDVPSEDRASWIPAEDRAPQKYEAKKEAGKPELVSGSPVPIIFDDMQFNSSQAVNALEGYVKHTKTGCLLLETTQKEFFELKHDMDVVLEDDTHIRVTGYISTLPYITCSDATVFYAERMKILSYPKEHEHPENDVFTPSEDTFSPEMIEAEGTMHRTEPEGMCWYFETDEKERYELIFSNPINLRSGMRLKIKAIAADVSTFCESGKPVEVVGWETVNENKF